MQTEEIRQLAAHAARAGVAADFAVEMWYAARPSQDRAAAIDAHEKLKASDDAARELRRAVASQLIDAA